MIIITFCTLALFFSRLKDKHDSSLHLYFLNFVVVSNININQQVTTKSHFTRKVPCNCFRILAAPRSIVACAPWAQACILPSTLITLVLPPGQFLLRERETENYIRVNNVGFVWNCCI
jgi:hypothetical protein